MATAGRQLEKRASAPRAASERIFSYEGKDRNGKIVRGEIRAASEAVANATLRRQNIKVSRLRTQGRLGRGRISDRDVTFVTRQLATMMQAGVPLIQSFEIIGRGHANPAVSRLLTELRVDVETGSSLATAFGRHPQHFDPLYVNIIGAGERGGILDNLLQRLAQHREKILTIKGKVKKALFYPTAVVVVAIVVVAVILVFVIPQFKNIFSSFGTDLPAPTQLVIALSEFMADWWYLILALAIGAAVGASHLLKTSARVRSLADRTGLRLPVIGQLLHKSSIARWTRTLATLSAAGVPLVDALDSVAGASGNSIYEEATRRIQSSVSTGSSLTQAMNDTLLFPNMVVQMVAIGEESGALDAMLSKVADIFDEEVDNLVDGLSSLLEPMIMAVLGVLIGGIIISVYLPLFKLGNAV
jgi:type IV pilus assembly protein PilC